MFTCPRCGGHEYKTLTLRDGTIERSCKGQTTDSKTVSAVGGAPVVKTHNRPCTFTWMSSDDIQYGLTGDETGQPAA